jgi:hypothetical protein
MMIEGLMTSYRIINRAKLKWLPKKGRKHQQEPGSWKHDGEAHREDKKDHHEIRMSAISRLWKPR